MKDILLQLFMFFDNASLFKFYMYRNLHVILESDVFSGNYEKTCLHHCDYSLAHEDNNSHQAIEKL